MTPSRWLVLLWLATAPAALAQRDPHIGYVYPAGGQQGTTFQVTVGGQYLNNVSNAYVSGTGVRATVLEQERQLTPKEQNDLKEQLSKLQEKRQAGTRLTPEEIKLAEEIKTKLTRFGRKLANPALSEFVALQVTVASNAVPGNREIRLATPFGLSNPSVFCVGQLPEFSKDDWKNVPQSRGSPEPKTRPVPTETTITLPATVNGQIQPGGVDRYRFPARRGQQLVVAVSARELIPYLADAVPGWFQAVLALYDAQGKELAYDDHYWFHPDPVLAFKIPKDGDYVLEIRDSLYRGREDFVYRIVVGELPFVTGIFPLGGRVGEETTVAIWGWNLPFHQLMLDLKDKEAGTYPFYVNKAGRLSNLVPFAVDTLPECFEREPNNSTTNAQPVMLPIIINGRINRPGDADVFWFEGRTGDPIVAEVQARRLDSPLDSLLKLTDDAGRVLAVNDDHEDKGSGLNTHHADSYLAATLPADGAYYVRLSDAQHKGGRAYDYRLRISEPQPGFSLRAVPSSLSVRNGTSVPITVYALRHDGFTNEIALALKDAPRGFKLNAAVIPANQDQVKITLSAPSSATTDVFSVRLEGRAMIQGRECLRPAVPADDMMQAFAYRHLVPAQDLKVAVVGRFRPPAVARILSPMPVKMAAGGTARVQVSMPTGPRVDKIEFVLNEPPDGITIKTVSPLRDSTEILLQADAAKVKPGQKGNLIVKVSGEMTPPPGNPAPPANKRRVPLGALPAIPYEIVER